VFGIGFFFSLNAKPKASVNEVKLAHFKGWKLMAGFVTRLWIVLRWLRQLARRGELNSVLKRVLVLTVKDLHFFFHLTLARLLIRLELHKRRTREESLEREADKRRQLLAIRRLPRKSPVERKTKIK
jgi:hypothetical protein